MIVLLCVLAIQFIPFHYIALHCFELHGVVTMYYAVL